MPSIRSAAELKALTTAAEAALARSADVPLRSRVVRDEPLRALSIACAESGPWNVVALAEPFAPDNAVAAGFLDRVVEPAALAAAAREVAERLATLDLAAHEQSKLRARQGALDAIRAGIEADYATVAAG